MNPGRGARCATCPVILAAAKMLPVLRALVGAKGKCGEVPTKNTVAKDAARAAMDEFDRALHPDFSQMMERKED